MARDKRIDSIIRGCADYSLLSPVFAKGEIGASYIFASGDAMLSRTFLEMLLCKFYCKDLADDKACLSCEECNKILNRTHIDITYFGESQVNIKKDEIRSLLENAITRPFESEHKFLVIENAENLSEMVQNLLLKTIEDMPSFVTIIIVTKTLSKILPTIKSRCQVYQLKPLGSQDLIMLLGSTEKALHMVDVADGVLSKALEFSIPSFNFDDKYKFGLTLLHNFSSSADVGKHSMYLLQQKASLKSIIEIVQAVFYLALKNKIQNTTDKKILAKMIRLCNSCLDLLEKNVLNSIVIDKFLLGILKCKVGA